MISRIFFLRHLPFLALFLFLLPAAAIGREKSSSDEIINFALLDIRGKYYEFEKVRSRTLVLFFTMNGCPLARQTLPKLRDLASEFAEKDLQVWIVNSASEDDRKSIAQEAEKFSPGALPVLMDESQGLASFLKVGRTGEAIAINTATRKILYRGAVDDQLSEGAKKPKPQARYLHDALKAFLENRKIDRAETEPKGCRITFDFASEVASTNITYSTDIAPIIQSRCVACHSEGNMAPFAFNGHKKVRSISAMIQEVVLARQMPPWHADPHYGSFKNNQGINREESRKLLRWIEAGSPRGPGPDPLEEKVLTNKEWPSGKPTLVVRLPQVERIPATGILDYRRINVKNPLTNDAWVSGVAIRPGALEVVHHVIVRIKKDGRDHSSDDHFLAAWAPGYTVSEFPAGTGKLLPAGAEFEFEMHYTTMGREQEDQTEMGIYVLSEPPARQLKAWMALQQGLEIAAGDPDSQTQATLHFPRDTVLYDLFPHMHLRGSWFKYTLLHPNGKKETLLSVPRYDFNWQTLYRLKEPKKIPAGSWILATGGFDNSEKNPHNPDPTRTVRWGDQSSEEMFIGFMNVAEEKK